MFLLRFVFWCFRCFFILFLCFLLLAGFAGTPVKSWSFSTGLYLSSAIFRFPFPCRNIVQVTRSLGKGSRNSKLLLCFIRTLQYILHDPRRSGLRHHRVILFSQATVQTKILYRCAIVKLTLSLISGLPELKPNKCMFLGVSQSYRRFKRTLVSILSFTLAWSVAAHKVFRRP